MPTDLKALAELLQQTGALAGFFQGVGVAGGLAALLTLVATVFGFRSRVLRAIAVVTLLAVLTLVAVGGYGTWTGYQAADAAVATVTPPSAAERQRRAAYAGARAHLVVALTFSAVPLVLGLVGLVVAGRRRWHDDADRPQRLRALVSVIVVFDLCGFAAAAIAWKLPLPGRDLDEGGWKVIELDEALDQNHFEACLTFAVKLEKTARARKLTELRDNQKRCAEHFIKADPKSAPDAVGDLKRLQAAPWLEDQGLQAKLQARVDVLTKPPPPTPEELEAARKKALAEEEEAGRTRVKELVRACFDQAAKKTKRLKLTVTLEVVVAATGEVKAVEESKGALKPAPLKKCVLAATKALKVPNTSEAERKLVVSLAMPGKG